MTAQIMVVDDDDRVLELLGIMLERAGFKVLKIQSASEALATLQTSIPDLFIIDVMMPGVDGIELCRRLRSLPQTAEAPIIILSARSDPESVAKGIRAGANDYLSKPVLAHDLVVSIRKFLTPNGKAESYNQVKE